MKSRSKSWSFTLHSIGLSTTDSSKEYWFFQHWSSNKGTGLSTTDSSKGYWFFQHWSSNQSKGGGGWGVGGGGGAGVTMQQTKHKLT